MRVFIAIALLPFLFSEQAEADTQDVNSANHLLMTCESAGEAERLACLAYLAGYIEGLQSGQTMERTDLTACLPAGITTNQIKLLFVKFAHEHPEALHKRVGYVLGPALSINFKCAPD